VGAEAVVALPGPELVRQTWICAVPMPRGICEGEAAGLTLLPSHVVSVPGIAECPVNLECRVGFVRQQYSHNAVFLRVVGASVDEELLKMDRLDIIRRGPTYEVDDATNQWGGAVERLGTNHELLECPGFPVGLRFTREESSRKTTRCLVALVMLMVSTVVARLAPAAVITRILIATGPSAVPDAILPLPPDLRDRYGFMTTVIQPDRVRCVRSTNSHNG
jgi:hypothetical protein